MNKNSKIVFVELPPTQFGILNGELAYDMYTMFRLPPRAPPTLDAILKQEGFTNTRQSDNPDAEAVLLSTITRTARQSVYFIKERKAKNLKNLIIVGGPDATARPEIYLRAGADLVVRGEGERTLPRIMNRIIKGSREFEDIDGLTFMDKGGLVLTKPAKFLSPEELSEVPSPFYDKETRKRANIGVVESSRGCPNDCDYCGVTYFYGRTYRMKSVEKVMRDLIDVHEVGYATFFTDDNIARSPKRIELFEAIAESGLKKWSRLFQADVQTMLNDKMRQALWKAGFKIWCAGIESFSDETLKNLGKPYSSRENKEAIRAAREQGFWVHAMMMVGGDGDTNDTLDYTLNYLKRNVDSVQLFVPTPLPGTRFTQSMREEGRLLDEDFEKPYLHDGCHVLIKPRNFTPYELQRKVFDMYRKFYSYGEGFRRVFNSKRPRSTVAITLYCQFQGLNGALDSPQTKKHLEYLWKNYS